MHHHYAVAVADPAPDSTESAPDSNLERLHGLVAGIVADDHRIRQSLEREALDDTSVLEEARIILQQGTFDFESRLKDLDAAERARSEVLAPRRDPWFVNWAIGGVVLGLFGLIALLVVGILKWVGSVVGLPIWPFVAFPNVLLFGSFTVVAIFSGERTPPGDRIQRSSATSQAELLRSTLLDQLRSLVVIPAIERASSPRFTTTSEDEVSLTDAPYLSSRVEAAARIQTSSYRDVLTSLSRAGGATIGLAGSRGVGKSELLQTFCADPTNLASMENGGTIGIVVPAPVVYMSESFLRVVIRRLAEAVPGYDGRSLNRRVQTTSAADVAALVFCGAVLLTGAAFVTGLTRHDRQVLGWIIIGIGGLIFLLVVLFRFLLPSSLGPQLLEMAFAVLGWQVSTTGLTGPNAELRIGPLSFSRTGTDDAANMAARINQRGRHDVAAEAVGVAARVRYVETRTESTEASASLKSAGFTRTSGTSLDQIPLTEADLVIELSTFVSRLHACGYQVRIGIDELDKLVAGDDAEKFLTGIKVLFPIRNCSFLLTISENASAQFARRGIPIRDVFDSSLDTVIVVQPLSFAEARRMVRSRLRSGPSEKMSDSQVLLCHALSGGLPRDLLRYCRQLGEVNSRMGGHGTLDRVTQELLASEIRARFDGVRSSLQARAEGYAGAVLVAELELIEQTFASGGIEDLFAGFLDSDESFSALSRGVPPRASNGEGPKPDADQEEWSRDTRRQIYCYLFFLHTIREAFAPGGFLTVTHTPDVIRIFDLLRDARQRLEADAGACWRRTSEARRHLGLAPVPGVAAERAADGVRV